MSSHSRDLKSSGFCSSAEEPPAQHNRISYEKRLETALAAAQAFIESHVGDPDMSEEMIRCYREYELAIEALEKHELSDR